MIHNESDSSVTAEKIFLRQAIGLPADFPPLPKGISKGIMQHMKTQTGKKKMIGFLIAAAVLLLFLIPGLYAGLTVRRYTVESDQLQHPVRIAQVSDLHSCRYGKEQEKLIAAIDREAPDIIVLTGDFFDDKREDTETEYLLKGIADRYPCFYVTGNHEYWASEEAFLRKMVLLEKYGVKRLAGSVENLEIRGEKLQIFGVDDPDKVLDFHFRRGQSSYSGRVPEELDLLEEALDLSAFSLLLSHRPELFPLYTRHRFDLVLSGHAHGGQWRLPWTKNGLYAPHQGLFPKYSGGEYKENGVTMIVSRGLARESTLVPRFWNPPELVIIDIQ